MNISKNVAKNASILFVGNILFRLISLFVVIYLARYLGVEMFGKYNFIFAYLAFFMITSDLGLNQILIREMSRNQQGIPKLIGNGLILKLILSSASILLAICIIYFSGYQKDAVFYVSIASLILIFQSFSDSQKTIFAAYLKMKYDVISKIINRLISAILIYYIIISNGTLLQIILVLILAEFAGTLLNWFFARKLTSIEYSIDVKVWKKLLAQSIPVALSSFFLIISHRIDVIMLSFIEGDISVGFYSAAYRLSEPLILISYALVTSLFPLMSKSYISSKESLVKMYDRSLKYIIIIMIPISLGIMLLSDNIIFLIYGSEYSDSTKALQILVWSLFFVSINYLFTQMLIATDKQKFTTKIMFFSVLINIILNIVLINKYSFIGASFATLITEIFFSIICFVYISKYLTYRSDKKYLLVSMISALIMGMAIIYLKGFNMDLCIIIAISIIAYGILLIVFKGFTHEEVLELKKFLSLK